MHQLKQVIKRIPLLVLLVFTFAQASGQVLYDLNELSGPGNDGIQTLAVDSKGNTYLSFYLGYGNDQIYTAFGSTYSKNEIGNLIKLDKNGSVVWMKEFWASEIKAISFDQDDNLYIAARYQSYSLMVAKLTPDAEIIWSVTEGGSGGFTDLDILTDKSGNSYVTGNVHSWSVFGLTIAENGCCNDHDFLVKFDAEGTRKWVIASAPNKHTIGKVLNFDGDNNILLAGEYVYSMTLGGFDLANNIGYTNLYMARINPDNGTVLELTGIGGSTGYIRWGDVKVDTDGSLFLTGNYGGTTIIGNKTLQALGRPDFFLAKMNKQGTVDWITTMGSQGQDQGDFIQISGDYLYVTGFLSGRVTLDNAQIGTIYGLTGFVSRFQKANGKADWIKGYNNQPDDGSIITPNYIHAMDTRRLRIFGLFEGDLAGYDNSFTSRARDLFTAQVLDTVYTQPGTIVQGKVFHDENLNCDPAQQSLKNVIIKAEPGPSYGFADQFGNYKLRLSPGTYTISQIIPQKRGLQIEQVCPPTDPVITIASFSDIIPPVNFGNTVTRVPFMEVDVVSQFRRCFPGETIVEYANTGLADASNVVLTVNFPEYVIPLSSSIPWSSKTDRQLIYTIPTVPAGSRYRVVIQDSVVCGNESIRGLTQCVTTNISPGNYDSPDPEWDGSDLALTAQCLENGFVRLKLKNVGNGNMRDSADFVIYANDILSYRHRYKLQSKDSLILQVAANGKTIHMEAFTTLHSPRRSVSVTIEGCGASAMTTISTGFVNAFPQSDELPELETFCTSIVDSFDPNDKQVVPAGITSGHNISGTEELEYFIRFQNTGTAVAYNVVIRDRLDPSLDLSTLNIGIASHDYSFVVEGNGQPELVWRFKNIMLPDSTADEPGSHGFVKFKIRPLPTLPDGTVIKNSADIIFDFNSPVVTNEVFNTIGLPQPEPANLVVVQDCQEEVLVDAGPDQELIVCDDPSIVLDVPDSPGLGVWSLVEGSGALSNQSSEKLLVEQLAEGINTLRYKISHCANQDSSTVIVDRVISPDEPSMTSPDIFCLTPLESAAVSVTGDQVSWYADAELTNKIMDGNNFVSNTSVAVYATDQEKGCESIPHLVSIMVKPIPDAPEVITPGDVCVDSPITLTANGSQLAWYSSLEETEPVANIDFYQASFPSAGSHTVYVTQTIDGCESVKSMMVVSVKQFDKSTDFMMNVITPNSDDLNNYFYIPSENFELCLGSFRQVSVYNRYGSRVFWSDQSDFKWNANDLPSGTYYYSITFGETLFRGSVSVIR